jgi:nucleotide-binding universal stress UspA family protein
MNEHESVRPVVVGDDGSTSSEEALDWAAGEAAASGHPLRIVATDLDVDTVPALLREAEDAELLVVGSRTFESRGQVVADARCPVVVVHARDSDSSPSISGGGAAPGVVVAFDGSELSSAATRFAFEAAARRRVGVVVVRPWRPPLAGYPRLVVGLPRLVEQQRRKTLAALREERRRFPEVEVEVRLVHGKDDHHGRALVDESRRAALVVLGSHGRRGLAGLLPERAARSVLEHSHCPVAVVKLQPPAPAPIPVSASNEVSSVLRWLSVN